MIAKTTDSTNMLKTLASLIIKDANDLSNALVFVPTRRAARSLEKILADMMGGAALLPRIVPLGEGDLEIEEEEAIGNLERKLILAELLLSVADKVGVKSSFEGCLDIAGELIALEDRLENEGINIRDINWADIVPDSRKAMFLDAIKDMDFGITATKQRNAGIAGWKSKLSEYGRVFCVGSTASVKPTRDLMEAIAKMPNGCVIFPGFVNGAEDIGRTDPYWSIKKFITEAGLEIQTIENGPAERIEFFNNCFNNDLSGLKLAAPSGITETVCNTEAEEANVAAFIAARACKENKSVMIITPDISGEQRINAALSAYSLRVDSSFGVPLSKTKIGRFAMLLFDYIIGAESRDVIAADLSEITDIKDQSVLNGLKYGGKLLDFITNAMEELSYKITDIAEADAFFETLETLSKILEKYELGAATTALLLADALKSASVRGSMSDDFDVRILGTAEARMQTADTVIITGLNDGMFPSNGFHPSWLSANMMEKIGLPSADSKISLMALDFITLSSNPEVYWTRSKTAGGTETLQSRFLSRVKVKADITPGADILAAVRAPDMVPLAPLDAAPPVHKYMGDYYATWLESLIHNPYLFYAKHILRLRKNPDIGDEIGAREFGTFVHAVLEDCAKNDITDEARIIKMLEAAALKHIDKNHILFRFWQNRFREMAPEIARLMSVPASAEEKLEDIYKGRRFIALADRVEGGYRVVDYKTGTVPSDKKLGLDKEENCTMPQLPLEAMILQKTAKQPVEMAFFSLKKGAVGLREYDAEKTAAAISALQKKLNYIMNIDTFARPEYVDEKYRDFDDLCRAGD